MKFTNGAFIFTNNVSVVADVVIFATGYNYEFPFLKESTSGIKVDDNYITPLYQHMINVDHPTMYFIGIPQKIVAIPTFHIQVTEIVNNQDKFFVKHLTYFLGTIYSISDERHSQVTGIIRDEKRFLVENPEKK